MERLSWPSVAGGGGGLTRSDERGFGEFVSQSTVRLGTFSQFILIFRVQPNCFIVIRVSTVVFASLPEEVSSIPVAIGIVGFETNVSRVIRHCLSVFFLAFVSDCTF